MKNVGLCVSLVNRAAEIVVISEYIALITIIPVAVFFRYVLNNSLVWAEELARYLFIWITFLGAGLGVGKKVHVGIDALTRKLPDIPRRRVEIGVSIGVMIFLIALIIYGLQLTAFGMENKSLILGISMGYVYLAAPVGGIVMLSNVVLELSRLLTHRSEERES
jgi:TRAP-type C4-dicarboxylate transport system permease small subunit